MILKREDGSINRDEVHRFLKLTFGTLVFYFNGSTWADQQVESLVKVFYSQYYYWQLADVKNFLIKCQTLKFGKIYGQFSPAVLMEWAEKYDSDWIETSENLTLHEHGQERKKEITASTATTQIAAN